MIQKACGSVAEEEIITMLSPDTPTINVDNEGTDRRSFLEASYRFLSLFGSQSEKNWCWGGYSRFPVVHWLTVRCSQAARRHVVPPGFLFQISGVHYGG